MNSTETDGYERMQSVCNRCGHVTGHEEPPDDASVYWVPHCDYCGAKITMPPVDELVIKTRIKSYRRGHRSTFPDEAQAWARHLHGRMLDPPISLEEYRMDDEDVPEWAEEMYVDSENSRVLSIEGCDEHDLTALKHDGFFVVERDEEDVEFATASEYISKNAARAGIQRELTKTHVIERGG